MTAVDTTAEALCPTPAKSRYATQEAAESAALRVQIPVGRVLTPYACPCGWHHLTSKPRRPEPSPDDIAEIHAYTADQFRCLVVDDARRRAAWIRSRALRDRSLVHRWISVIKAVQKDLNRELNQSAGRTDPAGTAWREGMARLQQSLGDRRREAAELIAAYGATARGPLDGSVKERRAAAGEAAVHRLIEAHPAEYTELLVAAFRELGLEVPERVAGHLGRHRAAADVQHMQSA